MPPTPKSNSLVSDGYNAISTAYTSTRSLDTVPELALLTTRLPPNAEVLDLGCGAGIPVASTFAAHGFSITGIDISEQQVEAARRNVPEGRFLVGDMLAGDLEGELGLGSGEGEGGFDAVVAMFSIFHLPRSRHGEVLGKVAGWLKVGGLVLMTTTVDRVGSAADADAGAERGRDGEEEEGNTEIFFGSKMYWSSWDHDEYRKLLEEKGFELLENKVTVDGREEVFEFADSKVDEDKPGRRPRLLLARKR